MMHGTFHRFHMIHSMVDDTVITDIFEFNKTSNTKVIKRVPSGTQFRIISVPKRQGDANYFRVEGTSLGADGGIKGFVTYLGIQGKLFMKPITYKWTSVLEHGASIGNEKTTGKKEEEL